MDSDNIFRNAYFGKAYKTRDGRKAILLQVHYSAILAIDLGSHTVTHGYTMDGTSAFNCHDFDIVGEWQEEMNEEELMDLSCACYPCDHDTDARSFHKGFKAGYKAAKQKLS